MHINKMDVQKPYCNKLPYCYNAMLRLGDMLVYRMQMKMKRFGNIVSTAGANRHLFKVGYIKKNKKQKETWDGFL